MDRLADGWTAQDVLQPYPRLATGDLQAVFGFVGEVMKGKEYVAIGKVGDCAIARQRKLPGTFGPPPRARA